MPYSFKPDWAFILIFWAISGLDFMLPAAESLKFGTMLLMLVAAMIALSALLIRQILLDAYRLRYLNIWNQGKLLVSSGYQKRRPHLQNQKQGLMIHSYALPFD
jgi:hypothetical protein